VLWYRGDAWREKLCGAGMALVPRGAGRSTFAIYEAQPAEGMEGERRGGL
jgi:hypothetical protein